MNQSRQGIACLVRSFFVALWNQQRVFHRRCCIIIYVAYYIRSCRRSSPGSSLLCLLVSILRRGCPCALLNGNPCYWFVAHRNVVLPISHTTHVLLSHDGFSGPTLVHSQPVAHDCDRIHRKFVINVLHELASIHSHAYRFSKLVRPSKKAPSH